MQTEGCYQRPEVVGKRPLEQMLLEEPLRAHLLMFSEVLSAQRDVQHDRRFVTLQPDGWPLPGGDLARRFLVAVLNLTRPMRRLLAAIFQVSQRIGGAEARAGSASGPGPRFPAEVRTRSWPGVIIPESAGTPAGPFC